MSYVEMPNSLIVTQKTRPTKVIYDLTNDLLDGPSSEVQCYQSFVHASKVILFFANLLILPHLLARKTIGKKTINRLQPITYNHI